MLLETINQMNEHPKIMSVHSNNELEIVKHFSNNPFLVWGVDNENEASNIVSYYTVYNMLFNDKYEAIFFVSNKYEMLTISEQIIKEFQYYNVEFIHYKSDSFFAFKIGICKLVIYLDSVEDFMHTKIDFLYFHKENHNISLREILFSEFTNDIPNILITTLDYPDSLYYAVDSVFRQKITKNKNLFI